MSSPSGTLAEIQSDFNWPDYLRMLGPDAAEPAPAACFKQAAAPSSGNEFRPGHRLEARDPRNPDNTCIASVVECLGPRLRLRLDGSDDRNDFYRLADSEDLFPHPSGRFIVPPLGYARSMSSWPTFLARVRAETGSFAPAGCFRRPPPSPARNAFRVGQRLEAVDRKNPQLVCPATVKEVRQDRLFVSFDGWRGAFDYWCRYDSRDIFPVGWCAAAGYPVQPPGSSVAYICGGGGNIGGKRHSGSRAKQVSGASGVSTASPDAFSERSSASPPLQPAPPLSPQPLPASDEGFDEMDDLEVPEADAPGDILPPQREAPEQKPPRQELEDAEPEGDMSAWSVSDVSRGLRSWRLAELCSLARRYSIDGLALQCLSAETLVHAMGAKVGPALKLLSRVEKTRRRQNLLQCLRSLQPGRLP